MTLAIPANQMPIMGTGEPLTLNTIERKSCCSKSNSSQGWCGRSVTSVKNHLDAAAHGVISLSQNIIGGISDLSVHTNSVAGVFRKLQRHTFYMIENLRETPGYFKKLIGITTHYVAVVDIMQLAGDVDYVVNKGWKEKISVDGKEYKPADSAATVAGRASLVVVDIGANLLWYEEMGFYSLKNAAAAIGNTRIFSYLPKVVSSIPGVRNVAVIQNAAKTIGELRVLSFVTKISPLFVTLRAVDLMYAFFAIDAAQNLVKGDTATKKTSAALYLSSYLAELTISAALLAGVTNVIALGTMGAVCISLALAAFFYKHSHEAELKPTPPQSKQLNAV